MLVGLVIGKGGDQIKLLQEESGAKINVTRDGEDIPDGDRTVAINGTENQIAYARQLIEDIVNPGGAEGFSGQGEDGGKLVTETFTVPNDKVGLVIGKGGETIKMYIFFLTVLF